jgi:hypothetical protein
MNSGIHWTFIGLCLFGGVDIDILACILNPSASLLCSMANQHTSMHTSVLAYYLPIQMHTSVLAWQISILACILILVANIGLVEKYYC